MAGGELASDGEGPPNGTASDVPSAISFTNPRDALDVDDSGDVSKVDVQNVIDAINAGGSRELSSKDNVDEDFLTALDAALADDSLLAN